MIEKNWKSLINTDIVEIKNKNENPFSATVNVEPLAPLQSMSIK